MDINLTFSVTVWCSASTFKRSKERKHALWGIIRMLRTGLLIWYALQGVFKITTASLLHSGTMTSVYQMKQEADDHSLFRHTSSRTLESSRSCLRFNLDLKKQSLFAMHKAVPAALNNIKWKMEIFICKHCEIFREHVMDSYSSYSMTGKTGVLWQYNTNRFFSSATYPVFVTESYCTSMKTKLCVQSKGSGFLHSLEWKGNSLNNQRMNVQNCLFHWSECEMPYS